ncbi:hypothetical protein BCR36DRAFT_72872 [Piromyces finnis]|uniref:NAD-dependent epimerase/dehydratase domain-containing protein n=1 Tax=Piromyces finnis TaxID=1754191 RepID=A0A1Y1V6T2_9FUNG|nr:hypothetical protein BCR36DRAFT_72872 [Piromyces finnis]|eukprot:ORX48672.1 hypothetical protein BCR36DRAFT_72872 [Piromyces finnis]
MVKVIITGTTGFVGEGVLLECLDNDKVDKVLSVSRRATGKTHEKLKELIIPSFKDLSEDDERLQGYDACFYCAGKTSVGVEESEYRDITIDTPLHFAKALGQNKDMTFIYVSAYGSDKNGKLMWAKAKGEAEEHFINMKGNPFRNTFCPRLCMMKINPEMKNINRTQKFYSIMTTFTKPFNMSNTIQEVGKCMISLVLNGYDKQILDCKDISICAKKLDS